MASDRRSGRPAASGAPLAVGAVGLVAAVAAAGVFAWRLRPGADAPARVAASTTTAASGAPDTTAGTVASSVAGSSVAGSASSAVTTAAPTTTSAPATSTSAPPASRTTVAAPAPRPGAPRLVDVRLGGSQGECTATGVLVDGAVRIARPADGACVLQTVGTREPDGASVDLTVVPRTASARVVELETRTGRAPTGAPARAADTPGAYAVWFERNGEQRTARVRESVPLSGGGTGRSEGVGVLAGNPPAGAVVLDASGTVLGLLGPACTSAGSEGAGTTARPAPTVGGPAGPDDPCSGVTFRRVDPLDATTPDRASADVSSLSFRAATADAPACAVIQLAGPTGGRWALHWIENGVQVARLDAQAEARTSTVEVCRDGIAATDVEVVAVGTGLRRADSGAGTRADPGRSGPTTTRPGI